MAAQTPEDTGLSILFFAWSICENGMIKVPLSPGAVGTLGSDPANGHQVADALRRPRNADARRRLTDRYHPRVAASVHTRPGGCCSKYSTMPGIRLSKPPGAPKFNAPAR